MIAWMNNWQYGGRIPTDPWRSAMSVPRELNLQRIAGKTELTAQPVGQLSHCIRDSRTRLAAADCSKAPPLSAAREPGATPSKSCADFKAKDAEKFGVNVRTGNGQLTAVGYDVSRGGIYVDRTKSGDVGFDATFPSVEFAPLKVKNGIVTLRILVDRSSVEVFADVASGLSPTRSSPTATAKGSRSSPSAGGPNSTRSPSGSYGPPGSSTSQAVEPASSIRAGPALRSRRATAEAAASEDT